MVQGSLSQGLLGINKCSCSEGDVDEAPLEDKKELTMAPKLPLLPHLCHYTGGSCFTVAVPGMQAMATGSPDSRQESWDSRGEGLRQER